MATPQTETRIENQEELRAHYGEVNYRAKLKQMPKLEKHSRRFISLSPFFVLSTGPSVGVKQFGIGLAAGIIFDATVIRALLVPALMRLFGEANWYLPARVARVLRVRPGAVAPAPDSV